MLNTILGSLLPVVITFLLGIFAASRREFKMEHAIAFNRLVMHYTLPLALFVATLRTSPGNSRPMSRWSSRSRDAWCSPSRSLAW